MLLVAFSALLLSTATGPLPRTQNTPAPAVALGAEFDAVVTGGIAPLAVQFIDSSYGTPSKWRWDFGDGTTSQSRNPVHTYTQPGTFSVSLFVSRPGKQSRLTKPDFILSTTIPAGFSDELLFQSKRQTVGFKVMGPDDFLLWTKGGEAWRWLDGAFAPSPMLDLREEVGNWNDHGMLGFALDPAYAVNGHIYALYVVDRHYLDFFGTTSYSATSNDYNRETVARLTRYTVLDPTDPFTTVDPASRTILLGDSIATGIPICATTHGVGQLRFGEDGSLLVSIGDASFGPGYEAGCVSSGITSPKTDIGHFRSQLLDSPNGKILRIDPATGSGMADNPFFDAGKPLSWPSRVWTLGLRNPFRFTVRPGSGGGNNPGTIYVGDVGNSEYEELSVVDTGGLNLGFPLFEGFDGGTYWAQVTTRNLDAPNPLFGTPGCTEPFFAFQDLLVEDSLHPPFWPNPCNPLQAITTNAPLFVHRRPSIAWGHRTRFSQPTALVRDFDSNGNAVAMPIDSPASPVFGSPFFGNCVAGGVWYDGYKFPAPFQNVYLQADFGERWIRALEFDPTGNLLAVYPFHAAAGSILHLETDPARDAIYYVELGNRMLHRVSYEANAKPKASATASPQFGPGPLLVQLSSDQSSDPEKAPLTTNWDFGDGGPWSPVQTWPNPAHVYPSEDITSLGTLIYPVPSLSAHHASLQPGQIPPTPAPDLPVIHDGIFPPIGSTSSAGQAVITSQRPWIGLLHPVREVVSLLFQEGVDQGPSTRVPPTFRVESWDAASSTWIEVSNLEVSSGPPCQPGDSFESFLLTFSPVRTTAVRLRETSGPGARKSLTVGELRAFATPEPSSNAPVSSVAVLTVSDPFGVTDTAGVLISANNTPPSVGLISPPQNNAGTYPVGPTTLLPLSASVSDAESPSASLTCEWTISLVHSNHSHPEPLITGCTGTHTIQPHGELQGETIYWHFEVTVTDPEGLATTAETDLLPEGDCNLNGTLDTDDITNGISQDANANGVPDECEAP